MPRLTGTNHENQPFPRRMGLIIHAPPWGEREHSGCKLPSHGTIVVIRKLRGIFRCYFTRKTLERNASGRVASKFSLPFVDAKKAKRRVTHPCGSHFLLSLLGLPF